MLIILPKNRYVLICMDVVVFPQHCCRSGDQSIQLKTTDFVISLLTLYNNILIEIIIQFNSNHKQCVL